jgi:hypothetical protein
MQTPNNTNTMTATHCKVQCGKEFRRFLLPNSHYEVLATQIRTLFGFSHEEPISIKYTDEEGDMVTISSDEELKFAIELFAGGLIRLTINKKRSCPAAHEGNKWEHKWEHKGEHFQHGHRWEHKLEGKWSDEAGKEKCENRGEMWKAKWEAKLKANPQLLQKKIGIFQFKLNKLQARKQFLQGKAATQNNPSLANRVGHIQAKIDRFEARLAQLQALTSKGANPQEAGSLVNQQAPAPLVPQVPVGTSQPTTVAPSAPSVEDASSESSCESFREKIQPLKQQIRGIRTRAAAGEISKEEAAMQLYALQEELGSIKAARKARLVAKREARRKN